MINIESILDCMATICTALSAIQISELHTYVAFCNVFYDMLGIESELSLSI